jgi:DNA (cytosine-5)-methyltransferase 1
VLVKVLNLYAGIGGNRKLWEDVEVTAVELDPSIASIYKDFFPDDEIVVGDAHEYLLDNFKGFDFIWSSPPCPTHSIIRNIAGVGRGQNEPVYPDMRLYQEIIFLNQITHSKGCDFWGKWCVENVRSYYKPLIKPHDIARHYFWSNFHIRPHKSKKRNKDSIQSLNDFTGFNISNQILLRNCVEPELGLHILEESKQELHQELF